jgi:integrase
MKRKEHRVGFTAAQSIGRVLVAVTVLTNARKKPWTPRGFASAVEDARTAAKVATGKTLHDLRATFATRLMHNGFEDREIDEVLGWETGKSARIRRVYISRKAVVISAIERMRKLMARMTPFRPYHSPSGGRRVSTPIALRHARDR